MPDPQPVHIDGCIDPPMRRSLQQLAQNDLYLIQLGDVVNGLVADVTQLKGPGPKKLNGRPAQIYLDNSESYNIVPPKLRPAVLAKLTTPMPAYSATFTSRKCKCKLFVSKGDGTWDVSGDEFDIYDFSGNFWYLVANDYAYLNWDAQEEKWIVVGTNSPDHREGQLVGSLSATTSTTVAWLVYGSPPSYSGAVADVYGYLVPSGKSLAANTIVKCNACQLRKKWVVYSSNACAT